MLQSALTAIVLAINEMLYLSGLAAVVVVPSFISVFCHCQTLRVRSAAVPEPELNEHVVALATRISAVPKNQLMMMKLVVNQAVESMGLAQTQMFATLFDGIARHSPEGVWFKQRAEEKGFKEAVRERDSGEPIAEGVSKPFYRF